MASVTIISTNDALVEQSEDGVKWRELPFVGTISATGAEAPETEVNAFRGSGKISGRERVASLSLNVASYVPGHRSWRDVARASREGRRLNWRITTIETIVQAALAETKLAVAKATGAVTVTGNKAADLDFTKTNFSLGMAVQIGAGGTGKLYSVDFIGDGELEYEGNAVNKGVMHVSDPAQDGKAEPLAADLAETDKYKFVIPSYILGPFLATPSGRGNFEMAVEAAITASTTLVPSVQPEWLMRVVKQLA